jgi:hypothetical protein
MGDIEEDRVFDDRSGKLQAFVATDSGLVAVETSNARVGRFRTVVREPCRDVATDGTRVAVATDRDVCVSEDGASFTDTGFGAAVAVTFHDDRLVAASKGGRIARAVDDGWEEIGTCSSVRSLDGPLVAANTGVRRVDDDLDDAGLEDVRDVSATGIPLAVTSTALYSLGNGWMEQASGDFHAVSDSGSRAVALASDAVYVRDRDGWSPLDLPTDEAVVAAAAGPETLLFVTESGSMLLDHQGDVRSRALGLRGVRALAVR